VTNLVEELSGEDVHKNLVKFLSSGGKFTCKLRVNLHVSFFLCLLQEQKYDNGNRSMWSTSCLEMEAQQFNNCDRACKNRACGLKYTMLFDETHLSGEM